MRDHAAIIIFNLLRRRRVADREGDEETSARISRMISDLEWAYPEVVPDPKAKAEDTP